MTGIRKPKRAEEFKELYLQGETLQDIGDFYNLSRERVRQVLKSVGITGKDGGAKKKSSDRKNKEEKRLEHECLKRWGCTRALWKELRAMDRNYNMTPIRKYVEQKRYARLFNIEWNLTLTEWWNIWKDSGKYNHRGRSDGDYVMRRINNNGAYEAGNVGIVTCNDNSRAKYNHGNIAYVWGGDTGADRNHPIYNKTLTPEEVYEMNCDNFSDN